MQNSKQWLSQSPRSPRLAVNQTPLVTERDGYRIEIKRNPFWNASAQTGHPFYRVSAFGTSQESAIENLLTKIELLKSGGGDEPQAA